ncbi:MAG: hypothetical protein ACREQF_09760, partial [Candidatus Binataceae bacterium]
IKSARGAPVMMIVVEPGVVVRSATVSGKSSGGTPSDGWAGWFWGVPKDGFDLVLKLSSQGTFRLTVTDLTWQLPAIEERGFVPRPPDVMPRPWPVVDSTTQVTRSFNVGSADDIR